MIRALCVPLLGLFVILPRVASGQAAIAPKAPYTEAAEQLGRWIDREIQQKSIPAVSIALVDDQEIVWAAGFGHADPARRVPATAETVYRVGSVSKLFTDIAVMQLVEAGKLDLDAPVTAYLPDFAPRTRFEKPITLRQLMSHRAGIVREPPVGNYFDPGSPTLARTVQSLNETETIYAPETRTKYSNAGVSVVGLVLERVAGEPFPAAVDRRLLGPLRLEHTSFERTPAISRALAKASMWTYDGRRFPAPTFPLGTGPAGNLYSNVLDLGRFLSVLFAGGRGPVGPILKEETLRQMLEPQFGGAGAPRRYGLGFALGALDGHRRVGHGGAIYGFATEVAALPDQKLGVVVIASLDCANSVTRRIADHALRILLAKKEQKPLPEIESTEPIDRDLARRLAGRYTSGKKRIDLAERNGRLYLPPSERDERVEVRRKGDRFIVDDLLAFGPEIEVQGDDLRIDNETWSPMPGVRPDPPPDRWRGLIGEYGWDHNTLYILEEGGKLHALIEWFFSYPLEEVSPDVLRFPDRGLYDGEQLVFTRDGNGRATRVVAASVAFERRSIDGEDGSTFRIKPLRPVSELRGPAMSASPPNERGEFIASDLVEIVSLDPSIKLDVRYATSNNFLGTPLYSSPRAFAQRPVAEALVKAHRRLNELGYGLLIHDAYRPWYVTRMFWDATPGPSRGFVANPARGSRHNRGAAIDLSLYDRATGQAVTMVGGYDEFSQRSSPDYPGGTSLERWHRDLLRRAMEDQRFTVNEVEWWHFDHADWTHYTIGNESFESIAAGRPQGARP